MRVSSRRVFKLTLAGFRPNPLCWKSFWKTVGDEMNCRQLCDVGDDFGCFRHQYPLSCNISVGYQHPKDVINIEILSPTYVTFIWLKPKCFKLSRFEGSRLHISSESNHSFLYFSFRFEPNSFRRIQAFAA